MNARIVSINTSRKRGTIKLPVEKAELKVEHGLVGDAHAAPGIKQVSLLAKESIERFQKKPQIKVKLKEGIFGENITTEGIELHKLAVGTKLKINDTLLEVSKIGKECIVPCFIGKTIGDCIMPKEGIFAKVIVGGEIKPEYRIEIFEMKVV